MEDLLNLDAPLLQLFHSPNGNPHSSNPSSDIKINSVRRAIRITLDIVTRPERPVRRARDIPTTVIAKTAYSIAHTGLRVLGMPPLSSSFY